MTFLYPTDDNENRVRGVVDRFIGTETPDQIMEELIGVLSEGGKIPVAGKYYTFFYNAKTPGTCLLYTSPSPRDATLSRMPSSA